MTGLFSQETRQRLAVKPGEMRIVRWAAAFFFLVLMGYSILRPVREQLGLAGGVRNLPYLFLVTWLTMLLLNPVYGAVVSRLPRRRFIPLVYRFFMTNLLLFFLGMQLAPAGAQVWIGRAFFVWVSVFNLWVVSVFWSFMADHFGSASARRLYAWIAVGGTLGSVAAALLTWGGLEVVEALGGSGASDAAVPYLLLLSVVLLEGAVRCVRRLLALFEDHADVAGEREVAARPVGGGAMDGAALTLRSPYLREVGGYLLCYTVTGTLLYFMQAEIVADHFETSADRTQAFAIIDLATQGLTLVVQVWLTPRLIAAFGIGRTLLVLPLVAALAFVSIALLPFFGVVVAAQGLRRCAQYAVAKPAREVLFSVVPRAEKYKAKAFLDTFVYRTGDVLGAGGQALLARAAWGLPGVAVVCLPITVVWGLLAGSLGRRHAARTQGDGGGGSG